MSTSPTDELSKVLVDIRKRRTWVGAAEDVSAAVKSRDPTAIGTAVATVQQNEALTVPARKFTLLRRTLDKAVSLQEKLSGADQKVAMALRACKDDIQQHHRGGGGGGGSGGDADTTTPKVSAEHEAALRHAIAEACEVRLRSAALQEAQTLLSQVNAKEAEMQHVLNELAAVTAKTGTAAAAAAAKRSVSMQDLEEAVAKADEAVARAGPDSELAPKVAVKRKAAHRLLGMRKAEAVSYTHLTLPTIYSV